VLGRVSATRRSRVAIVKKGLTKMSNVNGCEAPGGQITPQFWTGFSSVSVCFAALVLAICGTGCTMEAGSTEEVSSANANLDVSRFQGWKPIGGAFTSDPAVVALSSGAMDLYGRGSDHAVWYNFYYPSFGWSQWHSLGGVVQSDPSAARWRHNGEPQTDQSIVAAQGTNGQIWVNATTRPPGAPHTVFEGWKQIPGTIAFSGAPAIVYSPPYLYMVAHRQDNLTYWTRNYVTDGLDPNAWSPWAAIPSGLTTLRPAITATSGGRVVVAALGTDNHYWYTTVVGTTWSAWRQIPGGVFSSGPAISAHGGTNVEVTGRGTDQQFWTATLDYSSGVATAFSPIGNGPTPATFSGSPSTGTFEGSAGTMQVVGRGIGEGGTLRPYWTNTWQ
jgi:hypothetical protein